MNYQYKIKICKACGKEFTPNSGIQLYCHLDMCKKQHSKDVHIRNKTMEKISTKKYYLKHLNILKIKALRYYKENFDSIKIRISEHYQKQNFGRRICPCGVEFTARKPNQIRHSRECRNKYFTSKGPKFKKNDRRTRDIALKGRKTQSKITPNKFCNTSIERAIAESLHRSNISAFEQNTFIGRICPDIIFRGRKLAVFCDGDYWHKLTASIGRDKKINLILKKRGWKVLRFWEWEIKTNAQTCTQKILEALGGDVQ